MALWPWALGPWALEGPSKLPKERTKTELVFGIGILQPVPCPCPYHLPGVTGGKLWQCWCYWYNPEAVRPGSHGSPSWQQSSHSDKQTLNPQPGNAGGQRNHNKTAGVQSCLPVLTPPMTPDSCHSLQSPNGSRSQLQIERMLFPPRGITVKAEAGRIGSRLGRELAVKVPNSTKGRSKRTGQDACRSQAA